MKRLAFLFALTGFTLNSWAALPTDIVTEPKKKPMFSSIGINGIYKFSENTEVQPESVIIDSQIEGNLSGVSIDVYKNEAVAVEFLPTGHVLLTLRLPENEIGKIPEQLIVSYDEFQSLGLTMISTGDVADLKADYTGYHETEVAGRRGGRARSRRHTVRQEGQRKKSRGFGRDRNGRIAGGGGNCVSVVKFLTGFVGTAGNGVGMASALLRRGGYREVSYNGRGRGTVCSWSGGWHGKGHVGWFDGSCFQPTYSGNCGQPGKRYRLQRCVTRGA